MEEEEMTEDLVKWVKENKRTVFGKHSVNIPEDMIPVQGFGELVWKMIEPFLCKMWTDNAFKKVPDFYSELNRWANNQLDPAPDDEYKAYWKIANAFLGKEVVQVKLQLAVLNK